MTTLREDTTVRSDRLDLPLMPLALLDALVGDRRDLVDGLATFAIPGDFPDAPTRSFLRFRRDQLEADPERFPWSVRAIVLRDERRMVGYVNFHGRPGVNDIEASDAVELGWTVFEGYRGRGYATEVTRALMDWAAASHGVSRFISSTTPDNAASLRVHEKLGFARTGQIVDGEIVFELRR